MTTRPLGAQISRMLMDRGVDTIFGIPGVHNQEMYRGIAEAGITHVLARHEQGAGFMADGYARATGKPGVAYVITGPGLCNIMTPMGQAYSDSVPMLVIASCLDEVEARHGQLHQMLNQEGAAATVCDWSKTARTASAAYDLIDRAFAEFECARPRPKALHVPIKLLEARADDFPPGTSIVPHPFDADHCAAEVLPYLMNAKRPIFILGGGAQSALCRTLLKACGAAAFTTYAGRGILGDDYPLDFGPSLARPSSADVIAQADVVIAIGTELAEVDLWRNHLGHSAPLIRVDIDPASLADEHRADLALHCEAQAFVQSLLEMIDGNPAATGWDAKEVAAAKARWNAETEAERPGILAIAQALHAALPRDTMIYSDMTQFAYAAKEAYVMDRPGHWHHPFGFGTLGYALPASIGGAVARRGLPTLAIARDYGFQYSLQELGAAVELGLSLPIILWDNGKLKEIEDSMVGAQIPPNAVVAHNPDFLMLARAYGALACEPATFADLQSEVLKAFEAGVPTLIRVTPAITS